jgi:hypothetical protein
VAVNIVVKVQSKVFTLIETSIKFELIFPYFLFIFTTHVMERINIIFICYDNCKLTTKCYRLELFSETGT